MQQIQHLHVQVELHDLPEVVRESIRPVLKKRQKPNGNQFGDEIKSLGTNLGSSEPRTFDNRELLFNHPVHDNVIKGGQQSCSIVVQRQLIGSVTRCDGNNVATALVCSIHPLNCRRSAQWVLSVIRDATETLLQSSLVGFSWWKCALYWLLCSSYTVVMCSIGNRNGNSCV